MLSASSSRYIPQKDPFTLVRAARIVLEKCPYTYFVWCGEGPLRDETEGMAKELDIHGSFRFLGFRENVIEIINAFDIFMLSSTFEGLPYALLEAMAMKLPVIATNVVGTRDVVVHEETGFLVPPGDPEALAQATIALIKEPTSRLKMGRNARQLVCDHFDVKKMVTDTQNVYKTLISSPQGTGCSEGRI